MEIARISNYRPLFRGATQKRSRAADSGKIVCSICGIDRWTAKHVDAAVDFPSLQQLRRRFYSGDRIGGRHAEVMSRRRGTIIAGDVSAVLHERVVSALRCGEV